MISVRSLKQYCLVVATTLLLALILPQISSAQTFTRDLSEGMYGDDVRVLQQSLNTDPDTQVAESGPGAPGQETTFFGPATKAALKKFQEKFSTTILNPLGFTSGTGFFGAITKNALMSQTQVAQVISATAPANPPTCTLTVTPNSVATGQAAKLTWIATNTGTNPAVIDNGVGNVDPRNTSGFREVKPNQTTTYTMRVVSPSMARAECSATLKVTSTAVPTPTTSNTPTPTTPTTPAPVPTPATPVRATTPTTAAPAPAPTPAPAPVVAPTTPTTSKTPTPTTPAPVPTPATPVRATTPTTAAPAPAPTPAPAPVVAPKAPVRPVTPAVVAPTSERTTAPTPVVKPSIPVVPIQSTNVIKEVKTNNQVVPTPNSTTCVDNGLNYIAGSKLNKLHRADGSISLLADASYVCRAGVWVIEGSSPTPLISKVTLFGPTGEVMEKSSVVDKKVLKNIGTTGTTSDKYTLKNICAVTKQIVKVTNTATSSSFTNYVIFMSRGGALQVRVMDNETNSNIEQLFKSTGYTGSVAAIIKKARFEPLPTSVLSPDQIIPFNANRCIDINKGDNRESISKPNNKGSVPNVPNVPGRPQSVIVTPSIPGKPANVPAKESKGAPQTNTVPGSLGNKGAPQTVNVNSVIQNTNKF